MQSKKQLFSGLLIPDQRTTEPGAVAKQLSFASPGSWRERAAKFTLPRVFYWPLLTGKLCRWFWKF